MDITLSFFSSDTVKGNELKEKFCKIAENNFKFGVKIYEKGTQKQLYKACMHDDLVIFDASIEDRNGSNYSAALENIKVLEHVLVVSRSYLPINFYGIIEGGTPIYPNSYTNEEIIEWLKKTIQDRFIKKLPRKNKGIFKYIKAMNNALDVKKSFNNEKGQIFISYRNSGNNYEECLKLKERIEKGDYHSGKEKTVRLISPGEFVYDGELLAEWRHWCGLSTIERWIAASDEIYVYCSEDYADSWWTIGEMMSLVYTPMANKLRVFDKKTNTVSCEHKYCNIVKNLKMNGEQKKRMARWFANCDPGTMGPESVKAIMYYQEMPLLNKSKYIIDTVFQKEFWQNSILHCHQCKKNSIANSKVNDKTKSLFDIDNFLWISQVPWNVSIKPEQIREEIESGFIRCPKCGTTYKVIEKEPRYLWMPVRFANVTGPNGTNLITIPTYVISEDITHST